MDYARSAKCCIRRDGYSVIHDHRGSSKVKHGGGIAIISRESVIVFAQIEKYSEFESAPVSLSCGNSTVALVMQYLYRQVMFRR